MQKALNNFIEDKMKSLSSDHLIEILESKNSYKSFIDVIERKKLQDIYSQFDGDDINLPPSPDKLYIVPSILSNIETTINHIIKVLIMASYNLEAFNKLTELVNEENINEKYTKEKISLLKIACGLNNVNLVSFLLSKNAKDEENLLEWMLRLNKLDISEVFLQYGSNPNQLDNHFKVPISAYCLKGFLFSNGKAFPQKNFVLDEDDEQKINLLIKYGADLNFLVFVENEQNVVFDDLINELDNHELCKIMKDIIRYQDITGLNIPDLLKESRDNILKYLNAILLFCYKETINYVIKKYHKPVYTEVNFKTFLGLS